MNILGHWSRYAYNRNVAVTRNLFTNSDEIVKISAPLHEICGGHYIDSTRLICVALTCWTLKKDIYYRFSIKKKLAGSWYHLWPPLGYVRLYLSVWTKKPIISFYNSVYYYGQQQSSKMDNDLVSVLKES
jgi:hypothetical protein